ncbi:hypothetical protein KTT_31690 [Tengunoibacter tsumagoiensis]|uniref:Uncharacterized protein n=1 Tax=Tengunoibacter tsumagoiensis TaxID=2014871 RepID=A0A402A2D9_9CHLR|nr:hypothetical protein KTT_31690 [Tengunoibacter tsumagoiensis]
MISFDTSSYTASILLFEATSLALTGVPVNTALDKSSLLPGALCAVLFFDEHNGQDAVLLATFPNGSSGLPTPLPGRLTCVAGYRQINNDTLPVNTTRTYTLTGGGTGLPSGCSGVLYTVIFTSSTNNASIQLAPHNTTLGLYATVGNLAAANTTFSGNGLLPISSTGQIDIKALTGTCLLTLYTYGYIS